MTTRWAVGSAITPSRRSLVKRAGEVDLPRAAETLLNDFRSGALGRITLETTDREQ